MSVIKDSLKINVTLRLTVKSFADRVEEDFVSDREDAVGISASNLAVILKALEKFQKSLYRDFEKFLINHISFSSANAKNVQ